MQALHSALCSFLLTGVSVVHPMHVELTGDSFASCPLGRICAYSTTNFDGKEIFVTPTKCIEFKVRSLANFSKPLKKRVATGNTVALGGDDNPVGVYDNPKCDTRAPHHWFLFGEGSGISELKFHSTKTLPMSLRALPKAEWAQAYRDQEANGPDRR
jgi:hypothetical protein